MMKAAMRASLKECLGDVKKSLRGKRMAAYGGKEDSDESDEGSSAGEGARRNSSGSPGAEKALRTKVASAEGEAHEEMEEAGNWREEEVEEFMKKKAAPKVGRSGSFMALSKDAKKKFGGKKG